MPGVLVIHYQFSLCTWLSHTEKAVTDALLLGLCLHQFSAFANIKGHAQQLIV